MTGPNYQQAFVLHSPYPDGTWRGIEKCAGGQTTFNDGDYTMVFLSREAAEKALKLNEMDPYFEIVEVTLVTPFVRQALDSATAELIEPFEDANSRRLAREQRLTALGFEEPEEKNEAEVWCLTREAVQEAVAVREAVRMMLDQENPDWRSSYGDQEGYVDGLVADVFRRLQERSDEQEGE